MTVFPTEQFKGATRRGVADIRSTIADVEKTTSAAIDAALAEYGETAVDFFHRSEKAANIDWVTYGKFRDQARKSLIETPLIIVGVLALIGVMAVVLQAYAQSLGITEVDAPPLGFVLGAGALVLAFPFCKALYELIGEADLGYTTYFKKSMRYRLTAAWAISKEAVYTARLSRNDDGLIEVTRVPFHEMQACVHANFDGLQTALLYCRNGDSFALSEPVGTTVSGAANLANHIWAFTESRCEETENAVQPI